MKSFLDEDFILQTETAKHIFHDYAEKLPIIPAEGILQSLCRSLIKHVNFQKR
ncbi:glucuronate isomerase [Butyrivibrio sp. MB2005]|uniref:glucuronate isomerase n=1 Tax=Butyrivibrio sp. MB2005 TaxID=1280678 RepID=UPI0012DDF90F